MRYHHTTVMLKEGVDALNLFAGAVVVDATLGGGGHAREILKQINPGGTLFAFDLDSDAINYAQDWLPLFRRDHKISDTTRFIPVQAPYCSFDKYIKEHGVDKVDAVLADLGVSSHQIDTPKRGFSYMSDGALDMRMGDKLSLTAAKLVNSVKQEDLERIIKENSEERWAKVIARNIVSNRPINTTAELSNICVSSVPGGYFRTGGHPAKRTFQALRIIVNDELGGLERFLEKVRQNLRTKGRVAVITFHSLEDRIVKQFFKKHETECLCPPKSPKCICEHKPSLKILTKKPILPSTAEAKQNPRAESAKLRIAEKT